MMPTPSARQHQVGALPPLSIVKMLWNRKWLILCCWVIVSGFAVEVVRLLPSVYKAEAVVLVDSQKIPEDLVTSTVTGDVADRLALISQSIMTSSRLLTLMHTFGLYRNQWNHLTQDELLQEMRADISVKVEKNWTGGRMQAFRLGYQANDPKTTAEVTNQLAGLYVAENLRTRQRQAATTVDFLHQQLREAKSSLDVQENQLAHFKTEHNGALPEQENALLGNLGSLRTELQGIQDSINQAQQNLEGLKASLSAAETSEQTLVATFERAARAANGGFAQADGNGPTQVQILREELRKLRLKYTPDYPGVQAVMKELQKAERQELQAQSDSAHSHHSSGSFTDSVTEPVGPGSAAVRPELLNSRERIATLHSQIELTSRRIETLQGQRQDLLSSIADCQHRIEQLPMVEQQMTALKRNYEESENHYNSLLQKELSANMATDMERSQDSERFTVVDPARVPQKPVKPKRLELAALGSFAGLAIGLLLGFALEFRKQAFLGEWELPKDIPILGRVPLVETIHAAARS